METDKHYFLEGLFIIGFFLATALFAVWLGSPGRRDDVLYRIHFPDSVSGLTVGDQTKKVMTGVSEFTNKVKENPSLLLRRPKESNDAERK